MPKSDHALLRLLVLNEQADKGLVRGNRSQTDSDLARDENRAALSSRRLG